MFPMKPEDAAQLVSRQHADLHEQLARERLAKAARTSEPAVAAPAVLHVGVAHRAWAAARHLFHVHPTTHGTSHPA
ncbi:MAG: hypothetical protein MUC54_06970 [Chloroflexi bacterium]|nr:hypothetical protein [Chloroflexota bacterium]